MFLFAVPMDAATISLALVLSASAIADCESCASKRCVASIVVGATSHAALISFLNWVSSCEPALVAASAILAIASLSPWNVLALMIF